LSLSINASDISHNSLLKGHYAFVLSGFSRPAGFFVVQALTAGSFEADGEGNLTSGVFDNSEGTVNQPFTGTYALGSDNRGTMSISVAGGTTDVLAFSCGSISPEGAATKGRIIHVGGGNLIDPAAGEFELQDTTAFSNSAISGSYAFVLGGWDPTPYQISADGLFTADGHGNISSGTFDEILGGTLTADQSLTGNYSIAPGSTNGRGTGSLDLAGTTRSFTFYVVSAHKLLFVGVDQANDHVVFIGEALAQSGGPFGNGSLNGTSVFTALTSANQYVTAGLYTFDRKGTVTVLEDENNEGTVTLDTTTSATYSVSSNGRVTVASGGSTVSVLYLISPNEGFILSVDPTGATGFFEPQATGPFTDSSIDGDFFLGVVSPGFAAQISSGAAVLSDGTINETSDIAQGIGIVSTSLVVGQTSTDTYVVSSNGRATTGSGNEVIYIVSPRKFVLIDVNPADAAPVIKVAEQ
jgi:hypothetical protein